jgi:hypothetical protein
VNVIETVEIFPLRVLLNQTIDVKTGRKLSGGKVSSPGVLLSEPPSITPSNKQIILPGDAFDNSVT